MSDEEIPTLVLVSALTEMLMHALERPDGQHLGNLRLKSDLRALRARIDDQIAGTRRAPARAAAAPEGPT
jgi:hypothetical protein